MNGNTLKIVLTTCCCFCTASIDGGRRYHVVFGIIKEKEASLVSGALVRPRHVPGRTHAGRLPRTISWMATVV